MEGNRQYKDSVFTDLFYKDEHAKKNLLSLYNALFEDQIADEEQIRLIRLENTVFVSYYNDICFEVKNKRIVLGEHQSTINENMPLRGLIYIAREYELYFPKEVRYRKKKLKVPTPQFFVFYNGTDDEACEREMRLSDLYVNNQGESQLELVIKVININVAKHHNLLGKCNILRQYSEFVEIVRKRGSAKENMEDAVKECIKNGILTEYLERRGAEVVNMLLAEYDYDTDIRVQREEAYEDGEEKGVAKGGIIMLRNLVHSGAITKEIAAAQLNITVNEFCEACSKI